MSEKTGIVQIHFILDGVVYACRYVNHTPRVGDEARFNNTAYSITRVCWCYDEEECMNERMNCLIEQLESEQP